MTREPVRVFVLDDAEIVRRGIDSVLAATADLKVVGEAATLGEARRRLPATRPDVAILDLRLPDGSGLDLCAEIRTANPDVRCIVLTPTDDDVLADAALMVGAAGFLPKDVRAAALVDAVRAVATGRSVLADRLQHSERRRGAHAGDRLPHLSEREHRILVCIANGLTNREISERLGFAEKTVANNISVLLAKLGVRSRTQAAALSVYVDTYVDTSFE